MLGAISILLALLIGFLLMKALDPAGNMQPRWAATLFDCALGTGVGIGLTSIVFLLLDVAGVATPASIFGIDILLAAVLGWQWMRTRTGAPARSNSDGTMLGFRWTWLLGLTFGVVLLLSWVRLVQMAVALPVGDWDAWALWNLRAKFLAGPGSDWRYALSPLLHNTHPDYPLLLPAFVARVWKAGGTVDTIAPVITALLFFGALIALLLSVVAMLRSAASAFLAGLVILATTSLLIWAPSQYADIPLAFYYLGAIALIFLEASPAASGRWALLWAGGCAGLAAWTKNEGIAFLVIFALVFLAFTLWKRGGADAVSRGGWLLAGAAPGILLTLWLKFFLAPAVDPLVTQGGSGLARLHDLNRYTAVASGFFNNLLNLGAGVAHPLILLAILAILVRLQMEAGYQLPSLIATAALALVFLSYCLVYLITPYGLEWQIQSSFDRLILQVWPSFLLIFFIQLRSVADAAPLAVPRKSAVRSAKAVSAGHKVK
jgi:hypothetical protein